MINTPRIPLHLLGAMILLTVTTPLAALTTAFSYQGRLTDGSNLANGKYDFKFQLRGSETGDSPIVSALVEEDLAVSNGLFSVELDFGANIFNGENYWLEISVRPGTETGSFTLLSPRQSITPMPNALYSTLAGSASTASTVAWNSITGIPSGFADGMDNDTLYSAGAGLTLVGTSFSIPTGGILDTMLAPHSVRADKIATGQLVTSVNAWHDDVLLLGTDNIIIENTGNAVQIAAIDLWKIDGNSGITQRDFLGTLDQQPLEFRVNNNRALRLEPNPNSPNIIGGMSGNFAAPGVFGAVIGGGGGTDAFNRITDHYGTVSGGVGNQAGNNDGNYFVGRYATVSGGYFNWAAGDASTVGGGTYCTAEGELATVAGGSYNVAIGYASVISGGGGYSASLDRPIPNRAVGFWSSIGGGADNSTADEFATIAGGGENKAGGIYGNIGGGKGNITGAPYATVPGGRQNSALGSTSFAAGYRARADHDGAFIWADGTGPFDFHSEKTHEFAVRATGGARFVSGTDVSGNPISDVRLPAGGGAWATLSDRDSKENFVTVNEREVLDRLGTLPIQTWNYKAQDSSIRHIGVMAQDFASTFQVGEDNKHVTTVDADGVALAAIKGLYQIVQATDSELKKKDAEIDALKERLTAIEKLLSSMNAKTISALHEIN